jgi:hypothetical protein
MRTDYALSCAPLSSYLHQRLSAETQQLPARYQRELSPDLQAALTADLNRILQEGALYEPARFAQLTLSPRRRKLMASNHM